MVDARKAILRRLKALKWSRYKLAEAAYARKGIGRSTVYDFLDGTSKLESGKLDGLLDLLGMDYAVVKNPKE